METTFNNQAPRAILPLTEEQVKHLEEVAHQGAGFHLTVRAERICITSHFTVRDSEAIAFSPADKALLLFPGEGNKVFVLRGNK